MKKFMFSLMILSAALLAQPMAVVAATKSDDEAAAAVALTPQQQACKGAGGTWDAGEKECDAPGGVKLIGKGSLVAAVVNTLLVVIGAASVIMMIIGGLRYVMSNGDQNAVTAAKNTILYSAIGLVVALLAYAITSFIISALSA